MPARPEPVTVAELRRQVIAGCGGGAMLYTNAGQLVDEYTAAVRMAERRRFALELAKATGVRAGSEYPATARLLSAAELLHTRASSVGVLSAAAAVGVLRWVAGYLSAPTVAADPPLTSAEHTDLLGVSVSDAIQATTTPDPAAHRPAGDPMTGPTFCVLDGAAWSDTGCSAERDRPRYPCDRDRGHPGPHNWPTRWPVAHPGPLSCGVVPAEQDGQR